MVSRRRPLRFRRRPRRRQLVGSRARRRRRSELRDYGDEFLDMDSDSGFGPSTGDHGAQASERGPGRWDSPGPQPKNAGSGRSG